MVPTSGDSGPDARSPGARRRRFVGRSAREQADFRLLVSRLQPEVERRSGPFRTAILIPVIAILLAVALVMAFAVVLLRAPAALRASSTEAGTNAVNLLDAPMTGRRATTWSSRAESVGASLTFDWRTPKTVDHIFWRAPAQRSVASVVARFANGSSLLLTADGRGDVDASFPVRTVSGLVLTVATVEPGARTAALSSLGVDDGGSRVRGATADDTTVGRTVTASTVAVGTSADSLQNAVGLASGWAAEESDTSPWVQLNWSSPRELSGIRLIGPSTKARAPASGVLRFSDGSEVAVGEVRGGDAAPTVVGFAPRMARSVRFEMRSGEVGLRGFEAAAVGGAPLSPGAFGTPDLTVSRATSCISTSAPRRPPAALELVCPETGNTVDGAFTIAVAGPASRDVSVRVFQSFPGTAGTDDGALQVVQRTRTSKEGLARFALDASKLPSGPLNLAVYIAGQERPLAVQVLNVVKSADSGAASTVEGRTLLWADEFGGALSASPSGASTTYASSKPERTGTSQFGDAIFSDPDWKSGNVGTVPGGYLRLRLSPKGDLAEVADDKRTQLGALLSSAAVGGGGVSAQYGYFEARVLGAPGLGTWPAFWSLSAPTLWDASAASGEVDTVELYGTDTTKGCHAVHSYTAGTSTLRCLSLGDRADWSLRWHTYAVDITPSGSRFLIDGKLVTTERGPADADVPYFFLINLASGGGWPVDLKPTGGIADMYVDWVRVYT